LTNENWTKLGGRQVVAERNELGGVGGVSRKQPGGGQKKYYRGGLNRRKSALLAMPGGKTGGKTKKSKPKGVRETGKDNLSKMKKEKNKGEGNSHGGEKLLKVVGTQADKKKCPGNRLPKTSGAQTPLKRTTFGTQEGDAFEVGEGNEIANQGVNGRLGLGKVGGGAPTPDWKVFLRR